MAAGYSTDLVVFDLDGTLLEGDSELSWFQFLFEKGIISAKDLQTTKSYFHDYENGQLNFDDYMEHILHPLSANPSEMMLLLRSEYLQCLSKKLRPLLLKRLEWHRDQGHRILLITATHDFLATPVASLLKIQDLICTEAERIGSRFTGKVNGIPAFREGKINRLRDWLREKPFALDSGWAYGDSRNDLPLLTQVKHPVAVEPDPQLFAYAISHGWEVLVG